MEFKDAVKATMHCRSQKFLITKEYGSADSVMWKKVTLPLQGIFLKLTFGCILLSFATCPCVKCMPARAVLLNAEPVEAIGVRRIFYGPHQYLSKRKSPKGFRPPLPEDYYDEPSFTEADSFAMGPEDAMNNRKYSPPAFPSDSDFRRGPYQTPVNWRPQPSHESVYVPAPPTVFPSHLSSSVKRNSKPARFLPPVLNSEIFVTEATVTSDYKITSDVFHAIDPLVRDKRPNVNSNTHFIQNNFTDTNDSHASVSSDAILRYQPPPVAIPNNKHSNNESIEYTLYQVPNFTKTDDVNVLSSAFIPTREVLLNDAPNIPQDERTETTVLYDQDLGVQTTTHYSIENKVTLTPAENDVEENNTVIPTLGSTKLYKFSSGTVAGIVIGVLTCITVVTSSVIYLLYRKFNGQCTSVVESKFNSDNCGYLDDSLRSSVYLNNHIELPKENSEEMTSLDNDSFLNSLETMTIQNYWADNTKNTKV